MTRGQLAIHAHFYQPERRDPFGGVVRPDPSAAPYASWTERITAECYRPNAERGTLERISYNVGPTLGAALAAQDPETLALVTAAAHGENALAQGFHHAILPLASARDRRTEIRWGLRDHEVRFGRRAAGFWLPETAVDAAVLRTLAEEGVSWTVLAPWQAATAGIETRRPHRVDLGGGRSLVVAFYDADLSTAVSFQPDATADADRFAREWALPRTSGPLHRDASPSWQVGSALVVVATDGELYGHHQRFRDLFLQRLVDPAVDRGFDVVPLGRAIAAEDPERLPPVRIADRTSWSYHHGVLRWSAECACATDARWKQPLRAAFERLAGAIDAIGDARAAELRGEPSDDPGGASDAEPGDRASGGVDLWEARDAYVDVVLELVTPQAFSAHLLGDAAPVPARRELETLLEAQRWRLAMFASDGWYWEAPTRPETMQVLRAAARAARLIDELSGTRLEARLLEDLALVVSPATGTDGVAIYRQALAEVGQPA